VKRLKKKVMNPQTPIKLLLPEKEILGTEPFGNSLRRRIQPTPQTLQIWVLLAKIVGFWSSKSRAV